MPARPLGSTGVAITNPLVLYRSLLARRKIEPDPAQHRLAIHLQKLYERLKDYEPIVQYHHRLNELSRKLGNTSPGETPKRDVAPGSSPNAGLSSLFIKKQDENSLALTRILSSHEAALQIDSPKGLMVHGEVGTGKSMLIDLFADCLPNRKKQRRHFNTFMLETLAKLESLRRSRALVVPTSMGVQDEYSLLWLARDMISSSPILFLDEFQLPDRAASKIMTNLMTGFFHLGGVLIATSNRMPEELAKAAGMEFQASAPTRMESLGWKFGAPGNSTTGKSEAMFGAQSEFAKFLEVLKARCEVWEMEGKRDYRRAEFNPITEDSVADEEDRMAFEGLAATSSGNIGLGYEQSAKIREIPVNDNAEPSKRDLPRHYHLKVSTVEHFNATLASIFSGDSTSRSSYFDTIVWQPSSVSVYGRHVLIPRTYEGICCWTFEELCMDTLGPADYTTIASTFHTVVLTDVPILSVLQKNEARRFITLLDALYEARCRLLVTAEAGPDDIFFPETRNSRSASSDDGQVIGQDEVYPETFSEIYQDTTAPFRPNIASYDSKDNSYISAAAPVEPDTTHARYAGALSASQLEDDPPNRPRHSTVASDYRPSRGDSIHGMDTTVGGIGITPDFSKSGIFTGEDEKFAFKRAQSRLWEMCGAKWWHERPSSAAATWWQPLDPAVRSWERSMSERSEEIDRIYDSQSGVSSAREGGPEPTPTSQNAILAQQEGLFDSQPLSESKDEVMFRHGASPFRVAQDPPPKFQWTHFWGMMKWGKKAGAWGKGVEGLDERAEQKRNTKEANIRDDKTGV